MINYATTDIAIVGGGLAGLTLALGLRSLNFKVTLIEAKPLVKPAERHFDSRCLSLSFGTSQILQKLNLWEALVKDASPIKQVHVSDRGHCGMVRLSAEQENIPALGYVIEMPLLAEALWQQLSQSNIEVRSPATVTAIEQTEHHARLTIQQNQSICHLDAKLLICADGAQSGLRKLLGIKAQEYDYQQSAIVANVVLNRAHQNIAYERFTTEGPLAMLPLTGQRSAAVWVLPSAQIPQWMTLSDAQYLVELQRIFGYRLGKLLQVGKREAFPLKRVDTDILTKGHAIIFGSASHHIHPVAGQGFNLTMRDISGLLALLAEVPLKDVAGAYQKSRQRDQQRTISITDGLVKIFSTDALPMVLARNFALQKLERLPMLKAQVGRVMMGLSS